MHTLKIQVHDSVYNHIMFLLSKLNPKELQIIEDKRVPSLSKDHDTDIILFSNHSANLIEDWKDSREDEIWQ